MRSVPTRDNWIGIWSTDVRKNWHTAPSRAGKRWNWCEAYYRIERLSGAPILFDLTIILAKTAD